MKILEADFTQVMVCLLTMKSCQARHTTLIIITLPNSGHKNNRNMKQAILIMAHTCREQLERLVRYFDGTCDIFIHVDRGSSFSKEDIIFLSGLPGVVYVSRKLHVKWGGSSIVDCQLLLMEQALKKSDFRYMHLISGQDYPLKPLGDFLDFFEQEDREFIGGAHLPNPRWDHNTFTRIQHFFFTDWYRTKNEEQVDKMWKFAQWQDKMHIRRTLPTQVKHLYGGSAWFSLSRRCCQAVIDYTHKHPSLLRRFRFTFAPDEIYIHTVCRHVDFEGKKFSDNIYRYIDWQFSGANHPKSLGNEDLLNLSSSTAFFARKLVYPTSQNLMKLIDKYLLPHEEHRAKETGAWLTHTTSGHSYDGGLAEGLARLCKVCKIKDVIDLGCGIGWYVDALRKYHIPAEGYDGNPNTPVFSGFSAYLKSVPCEELELTDELNFEAPYGMTLFLSVGEYIPRQYEQQLWKNLASSTHTYLAVYWAPPGTYGKGIVNPHTREEIVETARRHQFEEDLLATNYVADFAWTDTYKKGLVVLKKTNGHNAVVVGEQMIC